MKLLTYFKILIVEIIFFTHTDSYQHRKPSTILLEFKKE